jgi:hypothetical protein
MTLYDRYTDDVSRVIHMGIRQLPLFCGWMHRSHAQFRSQPGADYKPFVDADYAGWRDSVLGQVLPENLFRALHRWWFFESDEDRKVVARDSTDDARRAEEVQFLLGVAAAWTLALDADDEVEEAEPIDD